MKARTGKSAGLLQGARVYLSGPMDFVASRADEKKYGWRNRISEFLRYFEVTVFDPWYKPGVKGLYEYGREDVDTNLQRDSWTFEDSSQGANARAKCTGKFSETQHIDLRMVDCSDFIISYCPTNIYSVGTPHEIILCRQQKKPLLFVSPSVIFPSLNKLREHLNNDPLGTKLLEQMASEVPIKENPKGIPSLWYMPLVGGENFFDGFGFAPYIKKFGWKKTQLDEQEEARNLRRPLLPFLEKLNSILPQKWDNRLKKYVRNDEWLLWDFRSKKGGGKYVSEAHFMGKNDKKGQP